MTDNTTTTQDPAEIERDIRRTQDQMSRTVDRIGDQLTPRNLINSLLDKAEDNNIDARYLIDGARRNPLALAMIAGGAIWLISDSDAKLPSFGSGKAGTSTGNDHHDPIHRDYVAHMERLQRTDFEDEASYQRRRDLHRANYLMLDRDHDEDDHSFRQRLDAATEKLRDKRRAWADSASNAGSSARETGSAAVSKAQDAYASNPLIGGLIAGAVGAIFGTALPLSRTEEEQLSSVGETARGVIGEQKDKLVSTARDKKDELMSKVEDSASASANSESTTGSAASANQQSSSPSTSQAGESGSPFGANDSEDRLTQLAAEEPQAGTSSDWRSNNS